MAVLGCDAVCLIQSPAGLLLLAQLLFSQLSIVLLPTALQKLQGAVKSNGIALGPGLIGLALLLPVPIDRQLGVAEHTGLSPGMQGGILRQAAVDLGRLRFLLHPTLQALPHPHQALVGDVDHLLRRELLAGRWHQEGAAGIAEHLDHLLQLRFRGLRQVAEGGQGGGPADAPSVGGLVGEGLEQLFAEVLPPRGLLPRAGEFGVGLFGVGI